MKLPWPISFKWYELSRKASFERIDVQQFCCKLQRYIFMELLSEVLPKEVVLEKLLGFDYVPV